MPPNNRTRDRIISCLTQHKARAPGKRIEFPVAADSLDRRFNLVFMVKLRRLMSSVAFTSVPIAQCIENMPRYGVYYINVWRTGIVMWRAVARSPIAARSSRYSARGRKLDGGRGAGVVVSAEAEWEHGEA